jgi:hypothetical protein
VIDSMSGLAPVDALTTLLTTESLLLVVVGFAITFAAPGQNRVPNLPISAKCLATIAVFVLAAVGAGAGIAWSELFLPKFPSDPSNQVIACSLLLAIAAEPILAALLALGMRAKP